MYFRFHAVLAFQYCACKWRAGACWGAQEGIEAIGTFSELDAATAANLCGGHDAHGRVTRFGVPDIHRIQGNNILGGCAEGYVLRGRVGK
ncbi:hypothetical protein BC938DRAFT_481796 [Jimgerdemannia flammicorona]|uniref:Uncharacterized protein n=1 Tax=Jimgerdemannia flammicorona TaxID=994334 RepID=A0A433QFF6_9FUNG|nr:hypothetical protein BC938DRAFT_481796 [Jimgerdemannia flammicorona]